MNIFNYPHYGFNCAGDMVEWFPAPVYRCPECGGNLEVTEIEPGHKIRLCEGCTSIYELDDKKPHCFISRTYRNINKV